MLITSPLFPTMISIFFLGEFYELTSTQEPIKGKY